MFVSTSRQHCKQSSALLLAHLSQARPQHRMRFAIERPARLIYRSINLVHSMGSIP
jgi:hypothetical protein